MRYRIMATKYGYAEIEADSEEDALSIAEDMEDGDFDWWNVDEVEIVSEIED